MIWGDNVSSRMERYEEKPTTARSRSSRNQDLYDNLGSFEKYTSFSDVDKMEAVSVQDVKKNARKREGHRIMKDYDIFEEKPQSRKELDEFNFLYSKDANKEYDLNTVLKEARELRQKDEFERKRKLQNEDYNILESSEDELQKFKEEQYRKHKPIENEEELTELITTITSKELREKIDKEQEKSLLSDLMATGDLNDIVKPIQLDGTREQKILEKMKEEEEEKNKIDDSFYSESGKLKRDDIKEKLEEKEPEKTPIGVQILSIILSLFLIVAVGFAVYYIIMNF